jgi:hypothetical protein
MPGINKPGIDKPWTNKPISKPRRGPARRESARLTGEVVTSWHSDYTGWENATFGAGNHHEFLKNVYTEPAAFVTPQLLWDLTIHDRTHL